MATDAVVLPKLGVMFMKMVVAVSAEDVNQVVTSTTTVVEEILRKVESEEVVAKAFWRWNVVWWWCRPYGGRNLDKERSKFVEWIRC